jgi:hypothetical protein
MDEWNDGSEGMKEERAGPKAGSITRLSLMVKGSLGNNGGILADEFLGTT